MSVSMNLLRGGAVAAALLASGAALAQGEDTRFGPQNYPATALEIDDFVGTIDIVVENRDGVEISAAGPADPMGHLVVERSGESVAVTYDNPRAQRRAWSDWTSGLAFWRRGDNERRLEEFPVVTVRLPAGTPVNIDGLIGKLDAGDLNGPLALTTEGSLRAEIGDVSTAAINTYGSGTITLGDVAGDFSARASGSGNISAGDVQSATVEIRGSADVSLGNVAMGLTHRGMGSGDLGADRVEGAVAVALQGSGDARIEGGEATSLQVNLTGSGDAQFGGRTQELTLEVRGSGRARVETVEGPVEIRSSGSGDIRIAEGRADGFRVRASGSGDVHFGGTAVNADISTTGSGDVSVGSYEGPYHRDSNG